MQGTRLLAAVGDRDQAYLAAGEMAGHPMTEDYNGAQQEGFGRSQQTIRDGRRCLAGGVINSPQLLMLSGIGDPEALRAQEIPVTAPLAGVGRNLQDLDRVVNGPSPPRSTSSVGRWLESTRKALMQFPACRRGANEGAAKFSPSAWHAGG
jgi:choline dehydrogenase-like flavoprotein